MEKNWSIFGRRRGGPCIVRSCTVLSGGGRHALIRHPTLLHSSHLSLFICPSIRLLSRLLGDPQLVVEVPHAVEAAEKGREQPRRQRPVVEGRRPDEAEAQLQGGHT